MKADVMAEMRAVEMGVASAAKLAE